jgi:integrase
MPLVKALKGKSIMKNKPIYYENGGIKFTIYIQNNRYYLDFYKTDGTRIRKSTKKIATKENLRYIKMQLIPDILILMGEEPTTNSEKKEYTVEEWALIHFDLQEGKNRPQTIKRKKQHFYKHIYPIFGKRLVSSIGYLDLQQWQTDILKKNYKIETISTYRAVFFGILEHAVKADIIHKNYFISVPSPKTFTNLPKEQQREKLNPFTNKEIELMLSNADGYMHNFIKLMLSTGIRPGELIALEWENIDFKRRVIKITSTRNRAIENDPKTKSSSREVDMLLNAKEALESQLELTREEEKIFMSMFHKPFYSHDIIAKLFKELLIKIGIEPRPLYNLRHTFASQAITKGVNILWVSRMLGHKDISVTLQVYTKFIVEDDEQRLKNIEKLDKIL